MHHELIREKGLWEQLVDCERFARKIQRKPFKEKYFWSRMEKEGSKRKALLEKFESAVDSQKLLH